jgi:FSR family fosmidomycin resistance protein-like MFS transporter
MSHVQKSTRGKLGSWPLAGALSVTLPFLVVEFFDEVSFGLQAPAMPGMQADLHLTFAEVGLVLGLPGMINAFVEPLLLLLAEGHWRRRLIVGGGLGLAAAWLVISAAGDFSLILAGAVIAYPASGAFVTLSQASIVDANPGREAAIMARWNAAGSLGSLIGPGIMTASLALGAGWRAPYALLGAAGIALSLLVYSRLRQPLQAGDAPRHATLRLLPRILDIARDRSVRRWILLLQLSDLMLDVLIGYTGIYLTNVVGLSPAMAALTLSGLTAAGLAADLVLVGILDRVPGRRIVRASAVLAIGLYPMFLLVPGAWAKIGLILLIRVLTAGWYPALQAEAYAAANGRSAAMLALSSAAGVIASGVAWVVGALAESAGLQAAMWLLLLGPLGLLLFVPSRGRGVQ